LPAVNEIKLKIMKKVFQGNNFENYRITIIIGLFSGIFWIVFILWNRLIRDRLPRDLTLAQPYSFQFWIVLSLFIYFIFISLYSLNKIQRKWERLLIPNTPGDIDKVICKLATKLQKRTILLRILEFFKNYVLDAPLYLWRFVYFNASKKFVFNLYQIIACYYIFRKVLPMDINRYQAILSIIIFIHTPRIIAFIVFLCEILVRQKLEVFYSVAVILLIPVIFKSFRRIFFDLAYFEAKNLRENFVAEMTLEEVKFLKQEFLDNNENIQALEKIERILLSGEKNYRPRDINMSEEEFHPLCSLYVDYIIVLEDMFESFEISEKYDYIGNLFTSLLLTLSFMIWLLIILKLY
jgi:hypothetical protein